MDKYMYWLDNILYLGCKAKRRLLEVFHTPKEIYCSEEKQWAHLLDENKAALMKDAKEKWNVDGAYEELLKKKIGMLTIAEEEFPEKLKNIPDPPFALYYLGELPREELPSVAVIGARECSEYGKYVAKELGRCLGENGIQVISGMAKGVDGISQLAALEAGGQSFGIMGCGVDVCYPPGNRRLYERLIEEGGILSTYPPGTAPQSHLFPPRNRIVSGFSDVLVVVEARQKSGTAITVEMALEQGRDIYAVPGRVTDRLSDGCNKMLREGAHVFLSPNDFMEELKQLIPIKMRNVQNKTMNLKPLYADSKIVKAVGRKEQVIKVLDFYPQYVDTIAEKLKAKYGLEISVSELNIMLMELYMSDQIKQEAPGWFYVSDKEFKVFGAKTNCVFGNSRK